MMKNQHETVWYQRFLTTEWEKRVRSEAKRIFSSHPELLESAVTYVDDKFLEWVKAFGNQDSSHLTMGYFWTLYKNNLISFHRHHFGRFRPFKWVVDLGPPWPEVAELLGLEQLSPEQIRDRLKVYSLPEIQAIVDCLNRRRFGQYIPPDPEENLEPDLKQLMINEEKQLFIEALWSGIGPGSDLPNIILARWSRINAQIALDDDERLLLRMHFQRNMKYTEIAQWLNIPEHQARRDIGKILARIRKVLKQNNIDFDDF